MCVVVYSGSESLEGVSRMSERRPLSDPELAAEFVRFFGAARAFQLFGWAVWWGLGGKSADEVRRIVWDAPDEPGYKKSAQYRAVQHFLRFREHLAKLEGRERELSEIQERLEAAVPGRRAS